MPSLYRLSVCNRARAERRHANGGNYVAIPFKASLSHYCRSHIILVYRVMNAW